MIEKKAWSLFGSASQQEEDDAAYRKQLQKGFQEQAISKEFMPDTQGMGSNSQAQQQVSRLTDLATAAQKHRDAYYRDDKQRYDLYTNKARRLRHLVALRQAQRDLNRRNGVVEDDPLVGYMQANNDSLRTLSNIGAPVLAINQGLRDNLVTGWLVRGINSAGGLVSPHAMSWDNSELDRQLRQNVYQHSTISPTVLTVSRLGGQMLGAVGDGMIAGGAVNAGKALAATRAANTALTGSKALAATKALGTTGKVIGGIIDPGSLLWKSRIASQSPSMWGQVGRSLLGAGVNYGVDTVVVDPAMNALVNNDIIGHNTAQAIVQGINFGRGMNAAAFADPAAKQALDDAIEASARYRAAMRNGYTATVNGKTFSPGASARHFALSGKVNGTPVLRRLDRGAVNTGFQNARHIAHSTLQQIPGVNIPVGVYNWISGRKGKDTLKAIPNLYNQNPYTVGLRAANHWAPGGFMQYTGQQSNQRHSAARRQAQLAFTQRQRATNVQMRNTQNKQLADLYKVQYNASQQIAALQQSAKPLVKRMQELQNKSKYQYLSQKQQQQYNRIVARLQQIDKVQQSALSRLVKAQSSLSQEARNHGAQSVQMAMPLYSQTSILNPMYRASIADHVGSVQAGRKQLNDKAKAVSWGSQILVNTPSTVSQWTQAALPGGPISQALMYAPALAGLFKDSVPDSAIQYIGKSVTRPQTPLQNILGSTVWHNPGVTNNYVPFTDIRVNDAQLLGSPALRDLALATNMGAQSAATSVVPKAQQAFLNRLRGVPSEQLSQQDSQTFNKIYQSLNPQQQDAFVKQVVGALPSITNISALISLRNRFGRLKSGGEQDKTKFAGDVQKYIVQHFTNQINNMPGYQGSILRLLISLGLIQAPGYNITA